MTRMGLVIYWLQKVSRAGFWEQRLVEVVYAGDYPPYPPLCDRGDHGGGLRGVEGFFYVKSAIRQQIPEPFIHALSLLPIDTGLLLEEHVGTLPGTVFQCGEDGPNNHYDKRAFF